jgi:methionine-rich copper-binding protein CopC
MAWRLPLIVFAMLAAASGTARAHAIILDSQPGANATVRGPELDVTLRFNSRIDHERSSITLRQVGGAAGTAPVTLPQLPAGGAELLKAHAAGLAPGGYSLRWQVLSVDGHITRGDIPFTVGP